MAAATELSLLSIFEGCTRAELAEVGRITTELELMPERTLMVEGDPARQFVVVVSGQVRVSRTDGGREHVIADLGPGAFVGEMGLLDDGRCTATVRTIDVSRVLVCNAAEFHALADIPAIGRHLRAEATRRHEANLLADAA